MSPALLFAYGTLGPRFAASPDWVSDAVRGRLYDLGPHPALVDLGDPEAPWVEGHVRPVAQRELEETLDPYEGIAEGWFRRDWTVTRGGRAVWVYVYAQALPENRRGPLTRWEPPG